MILDAAHCTGTLDRHAHVAIVGAGPAGMTLARELSDVAQVLLIEAGGTAPDPLQESLLAGDMGGMAYPLTETWARRLGGSAQLWAGYCAMFDPHDFTVREWVPGSGWPFGVDELRPWLARAAKLLNLGAADFDAACCAAPHWPLDDTGLLVPTIWRFGDPTQRFERGHGDESYGAGVTTLVNACVTEIRLAAGYDSASELTVRTLRGQQGRITADLFVLACGGLETARLLLASDAQMRDGVGNASGKVGRYFMEHPHRAISGLRLEDAGMFASWTKRGRDPEGREYMPAMGLSPAAQSEHQVLNARAHVYRTPAMHDGERPRMGLFMEQAPNPESRVVLSNSIDALGQRRLRLEWHLDDLDRMSYEKTARLLAELLCHAGLASQAAPVSFDREAVLHSNHHLGTTRMSLKAGDGVVDADCRLHDLDNVYILGGSVFPTVSWANPTLTLMALAFRLADHLRYVVSR